MTPRTRLALVLALSALAAAGPRASAHPLFRIHVRPASYRLAPPRLSKVAHAAQQAAGAAAALAPAAGLAPAALGPAGALSTAGKAAALGLLGRR